MVVVGFFTLLILLGIYSYGFVDLNLHLTNNSWFLAFQTPLSYIVFYQMKLTGLIYVLLLGGLYMFYITALRVKESDIKRFLGMKLGVFFAAVVIILTCSFPAFTYDIFNYMTTASVTYTQKENPYIVMPIEIPNEPGLAYTRAANKVALYGPTWLLLSWIPHTLGGGNVWQTIVMFKLLIGLFYVLMLYLIFKRTRSLRQVIFFGLNPLILIEVLVSSHNDIVMMFFALLSLGIGTSAAKNALVRIAAWVASVGVKGATVVLLPLVIKSMGDAMTMYRVAYWIMFGVFVVVAPIREELYPWYAVWFLTFAALIPMTKRSFTPHHRDAGFIHGFSVALCIGLSLRHLPYILTREYGGVGPLARIIFTLVPVFFYCVWYVRSYGIRVLITSAFHGKKSSN